MSMAVLILTGFAILAIVLLRAAKMPMAAIAAVILAAALAYGLSGDPLQPSAPAASPEPPADNAERQSAAQQRLLANPGDTAAWAQFSDTLIAEGRSKDAVEGLRLAVRALPQNADLWVQLGSALMAHGDGVITPAARLAFGRASALDPDHPAPSYFLGLALLQADQPDEALRIWEQLMARTPPAAPWRADLESKIAAARTMMDMRGGRAG
ncbi:MAG: tetratricopeptide repeat protein [Pacificimonas sp.]